MWPVGFDAFAFGANMDGAVKCGDLLKRMVKFLCMLHQFLFAYFSRIDFLLEAERIGGARNQFSWDNGFADIVGGAGGIGGLDVAWLRGAVMTMIGSPCRSSSPRI